jgi:hypothetical protein
MLAVTLTLKERVMPVPGMTGGDQVPILKYNAKSRMWRVDDTSVDRLDMIVDLDNAEAGQMRFAENSSPDFHTIKVADLLNGAAYPPAPAGESGFKKGFRVKVKISDKLAGGKTSVRELASSSFATKKAFDKLFDQWLAARQQYPGKLPVVRVKSYEEIVGRFGSNYSPIFEIVRWVDRPPDLNGNPASAAPTKAAGAPAKATQPAAVLEPEDFDDDLDDNFS